MRVLLLGAVALLLARESSGSTGGPRMIEVLGYDPVEQEVLMFERWHDESGRPDELVAFDLGSAHPEKLVKEPWYGKKPEQSGVNLSPRWSAQARRMLPLRTTARRLEFQVQVLSDSLAPRPSPSGGSFPSRRIRCTLISEGMFAEFSDTAFCDSPIGVVALYEIPWQAARLAIVRYVALPYETGYTIDRPVLLLPVGD